MAPGPDRPAEAAGGPARALRLRGARRISRSAEIRGLLQRGTRSRTAHLDVFDSASPAAFSRTGVVVPKHRRSLVQRNRLKRRLRELMRTVVVPWLDAHGLGLDVMVRARREAYEVPFAVLRAEVVAWLERQWSRAS